MKEIENKLLLKKIRPTSMRLLVLQHLMERVSAISLTELEGLFDKADRTTLFRTLKIFESNKLIHKIDDGTNITKYALCLEGCECKPEDLHIHFRCIECQETFCITQAETPTVLLPNAFVLHEIHVVVKGICGNCSN